jgi:hypothetical protein
MPKKELKVAVSERAVIARLKRVLAKDNQRLCKSRENSPGYNYLGDYYIVDNYRNTVEATQVCLEDLAREVGALKPYEMLEN